MLQEKLGTSADIESVKSVRKGSQTEAVSPVKGPRHGLRVKSMDGEDVTLEELLILKCKLCKFHFSMESRETAKETKRTALLELIEIMDGESSEPGV